MKTFTAVDLFCGAGGESEGLLQVLKGLGMPLDLTAVNHWDVAVETHSRNHPYARHLCESIDSIKPESVVRPGQLDLLWASPECTHHSNARGGKPINDQSRATAWCVIRWAAALRPKWIGVENVREFVTWAPLGANGRPLKSRRGELFLAWVNALRALGYTVEWRVLCAADYGAATTRRRLFVLARFDGGRKRGPIFWPEATHAAPDAMPDLFNGGLKPWRAAREVIDWNIHGTSIFDRRKPLSGNTLQRIADGFRRQGPAAEPFLLMLTHGGRYLETDRPLPTVTGANRGEMALVEPFVLGQQSGSVARTVSNPLMTLATDGAVSLVQPYLVQFKGTTPEHLTRTSHTLDKPLPTLTGSGADFGLVEPFLVHFYGSGSGTVGHSLSKPLGAVTTRDRFGLVEPRPIDILFRMLQPHECAKGQGFPDDYEFAGTRGDVMKQVGNAVEVNQARALNKVIADDVLGRRERAA